MQIRGARGSGKEEIQMFLDSSESSLETIQTVATQDKLTKIGKESNMEPEVTSPKLFPILGAVALIVGIAAVPISSRIPQRGWIGLILLLVSAGAWSLIEAGAKSSLPMFLFFLLIAPVAVVYSFRARKLKTDRVAAKAAFVGSLVLGALLLFMIAGLAYTLFLVVLMEFRG